MSDEKCEYRFIRRMHRNSIIKILFKTKIENDEAVDNQDKYKDKYEPFDIEIIRVIAKGMAITCSDASVKDEYMGVYWVIVDKDNTHNEKKLLSSEEWDKRNVIKAEAVSVFDFIKAVKRNTERMNRGMIILNNDNSKLMRALAGRIEKVSYFSYKAIATIIAIKEMCK